MHKEYQKNLFNFFKFLKKNDVTKKKLQKLKGDFCKKYSLNKLPLTSDILQVLNIKNPKNALITKPSRTLSGVTVIAVMTKPSKCPGKCIYCPSYKNAPKSYTGFEPAAMRGKLNNFNPFRQIKDRIKQLESIGHPTNKIELIVMGGTFPATNVKYQEEFMIGIYQAITNSKSKNLEYLKKKAMLSKRRIIGLTFETRPDFCDKKIIEKLLDFGGTRVEIGVQSTHEEVLKIVKRGHGIKETIKATQELKDSGFKVLYHMMLGLPGSNYKKDLDSLKEIFRNQDYCPDMIKIYPCVITKYTETEKMLYRGEYAPYDLKTTIKLIADIKEIVPKWVRIMRIQRDIPSNKIIAGIRKSNLRQLVQDELKIRGTKCNCIRCCEPNGSINNIDKYKIKKIEYSASNGMEFFIYIEKEKYLLGFLRLRFPYRPFVKEINKDTAIVRELHVYGKATEFNKKNIQHRGLGKILLKEAEKISKLNKYKKIVIISGIGVREYYRKQGYKLDGRYMSKNIGELNGNKR